VDQFSWGGFSVLNGADHIRNAIESILKQTIDTFELIVIDDGSHDNTSDIVDQFAALDKRIRPLRQSNYGIRYSLNLGLRLARGQYIARQDADDNKSS
jgi:glycosyltransferase involved in cell wall biosynthesis